MLELTCILPTHLKATLINEELKIMVSMGMIQIEKQIEPQDQSGFKITKSEEIDPKVVTEDVLSANNIVDATTDDSSLVNSQSR